MADLGYEIDFLPVGTGERSGDAICFRAGDLHGDRKNQGVVVIDGGTIQSGQTLVEHIKDFYHTSEVDLVISTHPDSDHSSGLTVVLDQLKVHRLWMHRPWNHSTEVTNLLANGGLTGRTIEQRFKKSLDDAHDLEKIALRKGIPIQEPFAGLSLWGTTLQILGPSEPYYEILLPNFRGLGLPEDQANLASLLAEAKAFFKEAIGKIKETLGIESLDDKGETSPENNSSAIVLLQFNGAQFLFTGDAGIPALTHAEVFAAQRGIALTKNTFIQVPHHGSKKNCGPTILNRIVGPVGTVQGKVAFISCAPEGSPNHPAKKVVNAFIRRGAKVIATQGKKKWQYLNAPPRAGWEAAEALPFYDEVEE